MTNFQSFSATDLGLALRKERKALGMTQHALAQKANCRRETIIQLESGGNVSLYIVMGVLGALGKGLDVCDARMELERLAEIFGDDDGENQRTSNPNTSR